MDKIYSKKLGIEDYNRVKEVRTWLEGNPRWAMLIAFLQADDPYKL